MVKINHGDAMELEAIVRQVYGCERYGVYGLVNADVFENNPLLAITMVASFLCLNKLEFNKIEEAIAKYRMVFENSNGFIDDREVKEYINDLKQIVKDCKL